MVFETARQENTKSEEVEQYEDLEIEKVGNVQLQFLHPSRILVQGPSGSGKSTMILNILKKSKKFFSTKFDRK